MPLHANSRALIPRIGNPRRAGNLIRNRQQFPPKPAPLRPRPNPIAHHSIFRYTPVRVTSPHRDAFLL
jgi:hypothetical protein